MPLLRRAATPFLLALGCTMMLTACVAQRRPGAYDDIPGMPDLPDHIKELLNSAGHDSIPDHVKQQMNSGGTKMYTKDSYAQMGNQKIKREKAQKGIMTHIGCQVCELAIESFYNETALLVSRKDDNSVNKRVVKDIADRVCLIERKEGRWISSHDIVEVPTDGGKLLKLVKQPENGDCEVECITILDSCERLFTDDIEKDTLVTFGAARQLTLPEMQTKFCETFSRRCKGNKRDKVFDGKRQDYRFKPKNKAGRQHDLLMERLADGGVLGDSSGNTNPDVADRLFKVIEEMEMSGEL